MDLLVIDKRGPDGVVNGSGAVLDRALKQLDTRGQPTTSPPLTTAAKVALLDYCLATAQLFQKPAPVLP